MNTRSLLSAFSRGVLPVACLLLASCGFHLQGQGFLPPQLARVQVEYKASHSVVPPPLVENIKDVLRGRGAIVTASPDAAKTVLTLSAPDVLNQFNSVTSSGSDKSYTLIVTGHYHLLVKSSGHEAGGDVTVTRDYSYNSNVAVAQQEEVQRLLKSLQQELAERIFLRIRAAATSGPDLRQTGTNPPLDQ